MPDCTHCKWLQNNDCTAWQRDWVNVPINHIRACVVPINEQYKSLISSGDHVLEVGCGTWSPIYEHCLNVGAYWEGIDISETYYGHATIATRMESVANLSFEDKSFDFVIASQSLEHWVEFGTPILLGLWQCFRVCKIGGKVMMNIPIHNHGSRVFIEGDLGQIKSYFEPFANDIRVETWRKDPSPLQPVELLPKRFTNGYGTAYGLDIQATRKQKIGSKPDPYRFSNRILRELIDHRWDYLLYKIWRRLKIVAGVYLK